MFRESLCTVYDPFPSWSQGSDINKMGDSVVVEKLRLKSWPDHYVKNGPLPFFTPVLMGTCEIPCALDYAYNVWDVPDVACCSVPVVAVGCAGVTSLREQ